MCKKLFVTALLVVAGFMVYRHFDVKVRPKDQSPETQIRREREKGKDLDIEIRKYISLVATREVEVKHLEKELNTLREQTTQLEQTVVAKTTELRSNSNQVKNERDRARALKDLNRLADNLARNKAELKAKEEQFDAEKEALDAAHEELVAYQNEKRSLETELAQLDAKAAHLRVDEIRTREHFDKSKLAERTQRIQELRTSLEVREKERELRVRYLGEKAQPISTPNEKDVLDKIEKLTGKK